MTIFNWNYFNAESANKKSDITAGFLILQTPHKYLLLCSLLTFCCLQSVKDTKFESNSQLSCHSVVLLHAVCSPSKIQSLKAIHNYCSIKIIYTSAVCSPSKIQSLKAIHNSHFLRHEGEDAVCSPSKIQSLKAIHNTPEQIAEIESAVCSPSKIQSLKAIHNNEASGVVEVGLFAVRQRYKV